MMYFKTKRSTSHDFHITRLIKQSNNDENAMTDRSLCNINIRRKESLMHLKKNKKNKK